MKTISIKDLHDETGHWLRLVQSEGEVVVIDRGTPVARLLPPTPIPVAKPFTRRKLLPGVADLIERPIDGPDSTEIISSMRGED